MKHRIWTNWQSLERERGTHVGFKEYLKRERHVAALSLFTKNSYLHSGKFCSFLLYYATEWSMSIMCSGGLQHLFVRHHLFDWLKLAGFRNSKDIILCLPLDSARLLMNRRVPSQSSHSQASPYQDQFWSIHLLSRTSFIANYTPALIPSWHVSTSNFRPPVPSPAAHSNASAVTCKSCSVHFLWNTSVISGRACPPLNPAHLIDIL